MATIKDGILWRRAKQEVPADMLKRFRDSIPQKDGENYCGIVTVHNDRLAISKERASFDPDALAESLKAVPDQDVIIYLAHSDLPIMEDDFQPLSVLEYNPEGSDTNDKPEAILVALMSGNLKGNPDPQYSHTPAFYIVDNYLQDKMLETFNAIEGDIEKLMYLLQGKAIQTDMANNWNDTGTIFLMASSGEVAAFSSPKLNEYSWGCSSIPLEAAAPKKGSVPNFMLSLTKKEASPDPTPPPDHTDTSVPALTGPTRTVGPAPPHLTKKEKITWWYQQIGAKPDNFKEGTVEVPAEFPLGQKMSVKTWLADRLKKEAHIPKLVAPAVHHMVPKDQGPSVTSDTLPVLSAQSLTDLAEWSKTIKQGGTEILEPAQIMEIESKHGTLCSQEGKPEDWYDNKSLDVLMRLGNRRLQALVILCSNYRAKYLKLMSDLEHKTAPAAPTPPKGKVPSFMENFKAKKAG